MRVAGIDPDIVGYEMVARYFVEPENLEKVSTKLNCLGYSR